MDVEQNTIKGSLINNNLQINPEREINYESCIEGLNETGVFSAFMICFVTGVIIQLFSFDSAKNDFIYWFILGNFSIFMGIGFYAKLSVQIANLNTRKRKEFLGIYFISVLFILFFHMQYHGVGLLIVLCFFSEIIGYFQYARTYVEFFDRNFRKFFGNFGHYQE